MSKQKQAGFAIIEAVLIVVVLALLGGVGYYVVSKNKPVGETASQAPVTTTPTATTPTAAVEQSLNQAVEVETATEDTTASAVESEVDAAVDSAANVGDSFNENDF